MAAAHGRRRAATLTAKHAAQPKAARQFGSSGARGRGRKWSCGARGGSARQEIAMAQGIAGAPGFRRTPAGSAYFIPSFWFASSTNVLV
jgi:hypothetical protein